MPQEIFETKHYALNISNLNSPNDPLQMVAIVPWPQAPHRDWPTYERTSAAPGDPRFWCLHPPQSYILAYLHTCILTYFHLASAYCQWMDEMLHKADRPYSIPLYKLPDYPLLNIVLITTFTIDSLEFLKSTPKAKIRIRLYHICPNRGFQFPFFFSSTIRECCPQCPSPAMALWCIKVHPYIFPSNGYTISFQAQ